MGNILSWQVMENGQKIEVMEIKNILKSRGNSILFITGHAQKISDNSTSIGMLQ